MNLRPKNIRDSECCLVVESLENTFMVVENSHLDKFTKNRKQELRAVKRNGHHLSIHVETKTDFPKPVTQM